MNKTSKKGLRVDESPCISISPTSGDLSSSEAVTEFLASDEALDLPDRIEEVNAKRLDVQINEKTFIAVLFRKNPFILIY